ncbi:hypothetical protein [Seonamhaeicola marinus]|uniref:Uncharacterized protein n=1 Tax=Seonamhaeicola marinus TaxID=1912246 RepID=A0A5D0HY28_9FLAO|nr:hypothetical protein [Seonamhaeicola marinus]TYA74362.1 hypothetical protein FUA24_13640 [Seonamhaeicola marinus]
MKEIKQINLFISCPGDIVDEINSIEVIVKEISRKRISNLLYPSNEISTKLIELLRSKVS